MERTKALSSTMSAGRRVVDSVRNRTMTRESNIMTRALLRWHRRRGKGRRRGEKRGKAR